MYSKKKNGDKSSLDLQVLIKFNLSPKDRFH
jgi:hypothetical protein